MRVLRILAIVCCLLGSRLFAEEDPPNVPPELRPLAGEAKVLREHGNYLEAEKIYREILTLAPDNFYALSNLGVVLFRAREIKQAEEIFKQALAVEPEDAFSHCTLGIIYFGQGKYDDAIGELKKTLTLDSKNVTAHNYLGITLSQKGQEAAAAAELNTAVALDPNYADAQYNLAVVLATKNPPDKENARKHYELALKLGAERDPAMEALMGMEAGGGSQIQPGAVRPTGLRAPGSSAELLPVAPAPDEEYSQCTLGVVLYNQGKYDEAETALKKVLERHPENATAHNYLGITLSQKGQQDAAVQQLEVAVALDPKYADAQFNLAVVLATKDPPDKERARKYYKSALKQGADRDAAMEEILGLDPDGKGQSKAGTAPRGFSANQSEATRPGILY